MPTAGGLSWLNDLLLTNSSLVVRADSGLNAAEKTLWITRKKA